MYYRHTLDYVYPDRCDAHMIDVPHLRDVVVDEHYPYIDRSFLARCKRALYWFVSTCILSWLLCISHGLRIHGRENLRKHKAALKNGPITISNHVFYWDFCCIQKVMLGRLGRFPAWRVNLEGPNGPLIRMAGGIPIPEDNLPALKKFKAAMDQVLESKTWLHFYPEGSMWFFYPDIRPLKKAVFTYAVKYDRPVIPITFSFRPRRGILRMFSEKPAVDMHIGEPLYADKSLDQREAAEDLRARVYHTMQVMNGINPGDPTYNTDQNIDHYHKTM